MTYGNNRNRKMKNYVDLILISEKLYRVFLDILKNELQKHNVKDINNIQAMILYNIGYETLTISDIIGRKYYFGSNVSYNLKKMIEYGYLEYEKSEFDKRSVYIKLTGKGIDLVNKIENILNLHVKHLSDENIDMDQLNNFTSSIKLVEKCLSRFE